MFVLGICGEVIGKNPPDMNGGGFSINPKKMEPLFFGIREGLLGNAALTLLHSIVSIVRCAA